MAAMASHLWLLSGLLFTFSTTVLADPVSMPEAKYPMRDPFYALDAAMINILTNFSVPGGQLAVVKNGQLKLFRGYGYADVERQQRVTTDHVFRIASGSKAFTGLAVLKLIDDGRLKLTDKVFKKILRGLKPPKNADLDPRIFNITVQHLLQHTSGWDPAVSGVEPDSPPFFLQAAQALGTSNPPNVEELVRWFFSTPLDHDPGTVYAYSNFGFSILHLVIEKVSGMSYESYMLKKFLPLLELKSTRPGKTLLSQRRSNEVKYYTDAPRRLSMFKGMGYVDAAYGTDTLLELSLANGGWLSTAKDMALLNVRFDGTKPPALLSRPLGYRALHEPLFLGARFNPEDPFRRTQGLVWDVMPDAQGAIENFFHAGAITGTSSLNIRLYKERITIAYIFNKNIDDIYAEDLLAKTAISIKEWPEHDLFL